MRTPPNDRAPISALFRLALASGAALAVSMHLKLGAPVNGRDSGGRSPLMLAAAKGHLHLCRLLLDTGAEWTLTDDIGNDALTLASRQGHDAIVTLIRSLSGPAESSPTPDHAPDREVVRSEEPALSHIAAVSVAEGSPEAPAAIGQTEPATPPPDTAWHTVDTPDDLPDMAVFPIGEDMPAELAASKDQDDSRGDAGPDAWAAWAVEEKVFLAPSDAGVEAAARSLELAVSAHRLVVPGVDWSAVALHLPLTLRSWTGGFHENHDVVPLVRRLVAEGLTDGWVLAENVRQLAAGTVSGEPNYLLETRLTLVLQDLGIRVLDEDPDMWPGLPRRDRTGADADEDAVEDALAFLDSLSDPGSDLVHVLGRDAARSRPLSAGEEGDLFRRRDAALATVGASLRGQPAIAPVLQEWAALLEAGRLAPGEIVRAEYLGMSADAGLPATTRTSTGSFRSSVEVEVDLEPLDDAEPDHAESARMLAAELREAAATLSVDDLPLVMRRVMELAERKLGLDQAALREARARKRFVRDDQESRLPDMSVLPEPDQMLQDALDHLHEIRADAAVAYQRMVLWQARRFSKHLPLPDLVQEGHLGLMKAFERFEASRGARFTTYAVWWLRQTMNRAVQDQSRLIRIPVHLLEFEARMRVREEKLRTCGWEERRIEEAGTITGATLRDRQKLLQARIGIVNLDEATGEADDDHNDESRSQGDSAAFQAVHPSPLDELLLADLRRCLEQGLDQLDPRQRQILVLRFGLHDGVPMTLEEVGTQYGVTRERIRQVEAKAIARMRRLLPSRHFDAMQP